jgi:hypothetical protein
LWRISSDSSASHFSLPHSPDNGSSGSNSNQLANNPTQAVAAAATVAPPRQTKSIRERVESLELDWDPSYSRAGDHVLSVLDRIRRLEQDFGIENAVGTLTGRVAALERTLG